MSRFLKLSTQLVNLSYIKRIEHSEKKIVIKLQEYNYKGFMLFGFGHFETDNYQITLCVEKNSVDYNIVKKWIDQDLSQK
jgi:hypothetical protein